MTLFRRYKFLLVSLAAAIAVAALAGNSPGLPAGALPQKAETSMQDCAACHEDLVKAFAKNSHSVLEKSAAYKLGNPCEPCHGPGKAHIEGGGDITKIIHYKGKTAKLHNQQCLACHSKDHEVSGYGGSTHAKQGLNCADCHGIHTSAGLTRSLKQQTSTLCMSCHTVQKTEFSKPYHHRVTEKAMECTDCHQPHSGLDRRQVRNSSTGEEICFRCHKEKQGPFVFEHGAIRLRGCQGCHEPHGSNNPKMLVRATATSLCLECHSRTAVWSVNSSQPPSFHNLNSSVYRNCTTCHVMIHGSNFDGAFIR
ncbi:MAG: decaheme c-type cytochrome, DmsE family [Acidobacteria bacterium]|nr:decaheme c-type cytochrome, DmsE family [Acidobacteriota bacterium]